MAFIGGQQRALAAPGLGVQPSGTPSATVSKAALGITPVCGAWDRQASSVTAARATDKNSRFDRFLDMATPYFTGTE